MCVIAVKPKDVDLPQWDTIKSMWNTNKDGAGFMYVKDKAVHISKGFMEYDDLKRNLEQLIEEVDIKATPLVLHFRITTHGGTSPENTHPFPLTRNKKHLKALDLITNVGMAHNGIISSVPKEDDLSDTQIYMRDVLYPLSKLDKNFLKTYPTLINASIGASRLVFLDKNGEINTFGTFTEKDGVMYSNTNHERTYTYYNTKPTYGSYKKTYGSSKNDNKTITKTTKYTWYYVMRDYLDSSTMTDIFDLYGILPDDVLVYNDVISLNGVSNVSVDNLTAGLTKILIPTSEFYNTYQYITEQSANMLLAECGVCNDLSSISEDNGKNNIGGKKNKETVDIKMNADRSQLYKTSISSIKVEKIPKGMTISGYNTSEDPTHPDYSGTYFTIDVESDNWYYIGIVNKTKSGHEYISDNIFYRTKDGSFYYVENLYMSETENTKLSSSRPEPLQDIKEVRFNNVDIYSEYKLQESLIKELTE